MKERCVGWCVVVFTVLTFVFSLSDEREYCAGEPSQRGLLHNDRNAEEVPKFHESHCKYALYVLALRHVCVCVCVSACV